jgi:hypothetical protein
MAGFISPLHLQEGVFRRWYSRMFTRNIQQQ